MKRGNLYVGFLRLSYRVDGFLRHCLSALSSVWFFLFRSLRRILVAGAKRAFFSLQRLKPFRLIARKFLGHSILYAIGTHHDGHGLAHLYGYEAYPEFEDLVSKLIAQLNNAKEDEYFLVAKRRERIIGSVSLSRFPGESSRSGWWIDGLLVHWTHRRMGIGERLVQMVCNMARRNQASVLRLLVFEQAMPTARLYRKMGFIRVHPEELEATLSREVKRGLSRRVVMEKALTAK